MKGATETITVRMPKELLSWLRRKAATETMQQDRQVSINSTIVDILRHEMDAEDMGKERAKS
jgi:hypothetical protein